MVSLNGEQAVISRLYHGPPDSFCSIDAPEERFWTAVYSLRNRSIPTSKIRVVELAVAFDEANLLKPNFFTQCNGWGVRGIDS
jgi:hypothetical protein